MEYGHFEKLWELEPYYSKHVSAMTAEALHAKSEIAAELAWRDKEIERLRAEVAALENTKKQLMRDSDVWAAKYGKALEKLAALKAPVGMEPVAECFDNGTPEGGIRWVPYTSLQFEIEFGDTFYHASQLAQVQRERDELKELCGEMLERYTAYKKDAERYRWMRKDANPAGDIQLATYFGGSRTQSFDSLIDAAMQKEKE